MRVLSLFDGMSCGQIALKEIGITPEVYYASEIDKFAIKQTQLNFPNTIQVGDVRDLNGNAAKPNSTRCWGNGWTIKVIEHILKRIKES